MSDKDAEYARRLIFLVVLAAVLILPVSVSLYKRYTPDYAPQCKENCKYVKNSKESQGCDYV